MCGGTRDAVRCQITVTTCYDRPIFLPRGYYLSFYLSIFFSSPNLSGRKLDVYRTSTHGVALVRI